MRVRRVDAVRGVVLEVRDGLGLRAARVFFVVGMGLRRGVGVLCVAPGAGLSDATRRRRGARAALRAAPPWTIALRVKRGRCGARRPHVAAPLRLVPSPFSRVPPGSGRCAAGQMRRLLASGTGLGAAWKATRIWWAHAREWHGRPTGDARPHPHTRRKTRGFQNTKRRAAKLAWLRGAGERAAPPCRPSRTTRTPRP